MNIREEIVARRRARIAAEGHELGVEIPEARSAPLVRFPAPPGLICEVKRRSPSRGEIASIDPLEHIERYVRGGARSVSILTEEDHFGGSLADLVEAKRRFPDLSVLRKDFLIDEADIEVSYRAGADAVLLIASILERDHLRVLYDRARSLGMTPLVEVHDLADVEKVRPIAPLLVGCNARNLETFRVDLLGPLELRASIDWECSAVFESGIWRSEHARIAVSGGFDALLVGEAVVRDPEVVAELVAGMESVSTPRGAAWAFWGRLALARRSRLETGRPLVKICGLARVDDVAAADSLGADLLGFVLADSPRRVSPGFIRSLPETRALKVAVVATERGGDLPAEIVDLVASGAIDAIQFHGDESPDECTRAGVPYYPAVRVGSTSDLERMEGYRAPRVLADARSEKGRGGTGEPVDPALVEAIAALRPLWLAGGLGADNVAQAVSRFRPELVDASSRLEARPGEKEHELLRRYFAEIARVSEADETRRSR